jgi:hypothetical protein
MPANPQITEQMVEKAARAVNAAMLEWKSENGGDDASCNECPDAIIAKAALTAALADHVVVPREPDNAILDAIVKECMASWGVNSGGPEKHLPIMWKAEWRERARPFYRAMISAASPLVPQEG